MSTTGKAMHTLIKEPLTIQRTDENAIQVLFQQLLDAWNRGDGTAYGNLFTEDADYIAFDGTNTKGRQAIAKAHQTLFDTHLKGSRLTGQLTAIRFLTPDVALVHATGGTILAGKTAPSRERDSIQTLVATRQAGEWQFTAFHNNRIRPMASGFLIWLVGDLLWKVLGPKK